MRAHVYAHAHAQAADTLSGKLVESKLAACVNVIPGIKSTYLWEGKIENDYVSSSSADTPAACSRPPVPRPAVHRAGRTRLCAGLA